MFTISVLPLRDGGGCGPASTKSIADGGITSTPNRSYLFCKDKLGDSDESKWSQLLHSFNPHTLLTSSVCCEGNGNFGCETSFDKAGKLESCSTWFRCLVKDIRGMLPKQEQRRSEYPFPTKKPGGESLPQKQNNISGEKTEVQVSQEAPPAKKKTKEKEYVWYEMTFITRWEKDSCSMLCVNTPTKMQERIEDILKDGSIVLDFSDPFSMYIPLMNEIVKLYDISVWAIRDVLRPIEKKRENHREGEFTPEFSLLQEIFRHSLHVGEVLSVTVGTTEEMRRRRNKILNGSSGSADSGPVQDKTQYHMAFQAQLMRSLRLRQQSNQDRLQTEITLGFNMITMRDSQVLKGDSKAMKTVALVTMVFLPATFTSAIFSTSFFNLTPASESGPEKWTVSGKIYIFCVVSVGLTVVTAFAWYLWQYREGRDFKRALQDLEKQK